ncbi:MAG: acyl-CoA dehydrogenase family protein [Microthrixaceae bacterium]
MSELTDLHDDLRELARDVLAATPDPPWSTITETGWSGLEVPGQLGGAGATFSEVAVVVEQLGRACSAAPYLGQVVLSVPVLEAVGADKELSEVASGEARIAFGLNPDDGHDAGFEMVDGLLRGRLGFVPDVVDADEVVVTTADSLVLADLARTERPVLDRTRTLVDLHADGVKPTEVWPLATGTVDLVHARAATAIALDSLGLAGAMLDATVQYAKVREQFGQPIGAFQAVKHACADMLVDVTVCRELVAAAVEAVAAQQATAWVDASMAKSQATQAAVRIAGKAMQLHGGFGFTWEGDVHRYLKRAMLNRSLFGSPHHHRCRLAARYATRPSAGEGRSSTADRSLASH